MTEIEHVTDDDSHGPVAIFLSDEGRLGFVCRRDGAYWEGDMPQLIAPSASTDAETEALADARLNIRGRSRDTKKSQLLSMEEARKIRRKHRTPN